MAERDQWVEVTGMQMSSLSEEALSFSQSHSTGEWAAL